MPVEIYYAPNEDAEPVTLAEAQGRFAAAGIPCTIEPDSDSPKLCWLVFEPHSATTIYASLEGEYLVFATVEASSDDDPAFTEKLDQVLENLGFSAEDLD